MNYYIFMTDLFKAQEIHAGTYTKANRDWLNLKFFHTLNVVKYGEEIIAKNKELAALSDVQKQVMSMAFLMHDFGRAFEKNPDGSFVPNYKHGAEGMHYIKTKCGITDVAVLASVMCHDQIGDGLLELNDAELAANPIFQAVSEGAKQSIKEVRQQYAQLSPADKHFVKLTCNVLRDADTMTNLRDFKVVFQVTNEEKKCAVTPAVISAILNKEYVRYENINTLPDRGLTFLAWLNKFHFPETKKMVLDEKIPDQIKNHVITALRAQQKFSDEEIKAVEKEYNLLIHSLKGNVLPH